MPWAHDPNQPWSTGWTWDPNGSTDPDLVRLWGPNAISDPRQNPLGEPNSGSWRDRSSGEFHDWVWEYGAPPDPATVNEFGHDAATDPSVTPSSGFPQNTDIPPPDVVPPELTDRWNGHVPDATGTLPPQDPGSTPPSEPPAVPPYSVSPGSIRDAELPLYEVLQNNRIMYDNLQATVEASAGWDIYTPALTSEQLMHVQHNLLLQIADGVKLFGDYIGLLDTTVQTYVRADLDSFIRPT
jgi:hypothetical protein